MQDRSQNGLHYHESFKCLGCWRPHGHGFYAAAPYNRLDSQFVWVPVDYDGVSIESDPTGEVKFSGTVDSGRTNTSQLSDGTATLNPVNRTCMLATTIPVTNEKKSIAENLDLSKSPQAGSGLVVLPAAYNAGGDTYQYTEECRADGAYSSLNTWVYYKDNSIRLASNMGLCVTGVSIDDTDGKTPTTLQPCGTSYGVHFQGDYYTNPNKVAQQTEKNDPNSLLNKYQKWNFYNGFINAGYWNELTGDVGAQAASYDSALPESKGYAVAGVQSGKRPSSSVWKSPITAVAHKTVAIHISRAAISKPPPTVRRIWCRNGPITSAIPTFRTVPTCRMPPHPSAKQAKRDTAPIRW